MTISPGNSLQNRSSIAIDAWVSSLQGGLGVCLVAGIAAASVDLYLHVPLRLPGWRGLITMAILVAARRLSGRPWAASAAAFAAALTALALGGPPRFGTLAFLVPGLVIDAVCLLRPGWQTSTFITGVAAALGNVAKLAVSLVGFGMLAHRDTGGAGMLLPWASHFGFGLCGGLIAAQLTPKPRQRAHQGTSGVAR